MLYIVKGYDYYTMAQDGTAYLKHTWKVGEVGVADGKAGMSDAIWVYVVVVAGEIGTVKDGTGLTMFDSGAEEA